MKLKTQFTIPKKDLRDLDYDKKTETLKKSCIDYPSKEDCLVCFN